MRRGCLEITKVVFCRLDNPLPSGSLSPPPHSQTREEVEHGCISELVTQGGWAHMRLRLGWRATLVNISVLIVMSVVGTLTLKCQVKDNLVYSCLLHHHPCSSYNSFCLSLCLGWKKTHLIAWHCQLTKIQSKHLFVIWYISAIIIITHKNFFNLPNYLSRLLGFCQVCLSKQKKTETGRLLHLCQENGTWSVSAKHDSFWVPG